MKILRVFILCIDFGPYPYSDAHCQGNIPNDRTNSGSRRAGYGEKSQYPILLMGTPVLKTPSSAIFCADLRYNSQILSNSSPLYRFDSGFDTK